MLLSKVRTEKGLSMSALARKAEMHVSSISQIESGHLSPYPSQKEKITSALDWTGDIDELFEETEQELNSRAERTCFADEVTHRDCKYSINRGWRERTCENKNKSVTSFWCSKCDAATSDGFADVGGKLTRFNYCPNCGCKVVGE